MEVIKVEVLRKLSSAAHPVASPAVLHALRVRPNQALQRTGSARGFTLLSRFQPVVSLAGR